LGNNAFKGNQLSDIIIPANVTTIGGSAFEKNKLRDVAIDNSVTSIGSNAFSGNQLRELTIPDSITTIGAGAFLYNQLTAVTIPDSITYIGVYASPPYTRSVTIEQGVEEDEAGYNLPSPWNEFAIFYNSNRGGRKEKGTYIFTIPKGEINPGRGTWSRQP